MKILWPRNEIQNLISKKEIREKVMWYKRERGKEKEKKRKNGSLKTPKLCFLHTLCC